MTIHMKQDEIPTYMREIPEDPNEDQIENVKQKMMAEFQDVFSEEGKTLRTMTCIPAKINVVPEAVPIRISTARKLA